jgi:hypothetical protein
MYNVHDDGVSLSVNWIALWRNLRVYVALYLYFTFSPLCFSTRAALYYTYRIWAQYRYILCTQLGILHARIYLRRHLQHASPRGETDTLLFVRQRLQQLCVYARTAVTVVITIIIIIIIMIFIIIVFILLLLYCDDTTTIYRQLPTVRK